MALVLCTCASPSIAAAEPPLLAVLGSTAPETLVVQVTLNNVNKGQFFVSASDGDFLIRVEDLKAMGLAAIHGRTRNIDGEEMIALKSIDDMTVAFDERKMALELTVDPRLLPGTIVDFSGGRKQAVFYPTSASAFFNYDLSYAGGNAGQRDVSGVATELGARVGDFLFLSDSTYYAGDSQNRFVRLMTSLIHDDRDTLVRTVLGDFVVTAGDLSSSVGMGGVSYAKLYSMNPYFVSYPQQNLTGLLLTPSEVDVYIDGQRVRTLRLPAGEFDLRDITQAPGLRNVQAVVRDAFGREQQINAPFYSTQVPLKAGLHEFSYNLGFLREMYGVESNDYGPLAFAGFHRYGVTDSLTIGAHAEGKSGVYNAGATASGVLGAAGLLNVSGAGSGNGGHSGGALLASYSYLGTHFNAGLFVSKQSPSYVQLVQTGIDNRNYAINATIGYTDTIVGSISAGYVTSKTYGGQDSRSASFSYGRPLFDGRASFFVTVMNTRGQDKNTNVFAGLVYNFDANYALSARYERFQANSTEALQFQKAQPVGDGLGYTIAAERVGSPEGTATVVTPSFQYNSRWGILSGSALQQNDGNGSHNSYTVSAAGGITWVGGVFSIGRPVTDAFGVVKVDNVEGVRVFVNSEEIGRTDANGMLVLPTLTSFVDNQISINTANVPLEFSFPESMKVVSPPYRGGAVIDFHVKRLQAVMGAIKIKSSEGVRPAEFFQVTVTVDGRPFSFPTGRGGEYYVEDLKPGRYSARMTGNGQSCTFELDVPEVSEAFTQLPDIVCDSTR
jgi:outer membrane usher protein FimD/PapC